MASADPTAARQPPVERAGEDDEVRFPRWGDDDICVGHVAGVSSDQAIDDHSRMTLHIEYEGTTFLVSRAEVTVL